MKPTLPQIVRELFNYLPVIAWAMDMDGVVLLAEGSTMGSIGFAPGQLVGQNLLAVFGQNPASIEPMQRALAGEAFTQIGDSGGRTLSTRYEPMFDEHGVQNGVIGITIDETDRLANDRELATRASALREQAELLDLAHDAIVVCRLDGTITYWNRGAERMLGYTRDEAVGRHASELLRSVLPVPIADIQRAFATQGYWEGEVIHTSRDGEEVIVASRGVLRRGEADTADSVLVIDTDITARKRAEQAEHRRQQEIIRAQAQAIEELSTPLIPITDEILVMPIIGMLDSIRAQQVMHTLLSGLAASRGKFAILDITGVPVVDTAVANAILQAAHAARLLGTEVILTGIRPEVAQTLVHIGAELGNIITRGTLQSGIKYALARGRSKLGA
ncbi:MAG TPA: PAS domain S-box protein [Nannocystis sp.]